MPFRDSLKDLLQASGLDEKGIGEVLLAIQEVVTNVIRHAYGEGTLGKIEVTFDDQSDKIVMSVKDYGKKFDCTQMPDPELPKETPGGLGIYLVKQVLDSVKYDKDFQEGNLLHLVKLKHPSKK